MIDSITLKIHNLQRYPLIYEHFYNFSKKKKGRILEGYVDVTTGAIIDKMEKRVFHSESGGFLPVRFTSDLFVASSDYSISVLIDCKEVTAPTCEMTFSIPKYIYGTNIYQFIAFPAKNAESMFSKLLLFLQEFFKKELPQRPLPSDVQIKRIDFCYNQYFASRHEAMVYQEAQFEHMRNLARSKNARFSPGNGHNWTLLTEGYSFKCYHKGDEFQKNDYSKLLKSGTKYKLPKKGINGKRADIPARWNLAYLSGVADKCLRYEITYRNSFMHYMVYYSMFQSVEPQPGYVLDNVINRYCRRIDKMGLFAGVKAATGFGGDAYTMKEHYCRFQRGYFLKSTFDNTFDPYALVYSKDAPFNYGVFRLLYNVFWEKVGEAQLNERASVPEMFKKIQDYQERCANRKKNRMTVKNSMVKKGGVHTARLGIPALLSQYMDLRKLKGHLPENTYQRLMSDLKKAGIDMQAHNIQIVRPGLDYTDYMAVLGNLVSNVI